MTPSLGKKIGQGLTAEIFDVGNQQVLKLFYKDIPLSWAKQEFRINQTLVQEGFPVARVYNLIEKDGRHGIVYEKVEGESFLKRLTQKPWTVRRIGRMMAELHHKIQRDTACELPSTKDDLSRRILEARELDKETQQLLLDELQNLPNGSHLSHGDFHPDNLMFTKDRVVIIDWMTATKGHPLADAARTVLLLKLADIPKEIPLVVRLLIKFLRVQLHNAYMKRYIKLTQCSIADIRQWEAPVAAARLFERLSASEKQAMLRLIHEHCRSTNQKRPTETR
ncbi:phosphotransferase family protein [Sporolactobacillus laevolacticus]|uniref:phosphotransferase family protein n=1 Tax=Sporolactobacillus laevolacticus TaxID=33018 RepID=UPI0025B3D4FD|nr:phosphotransferase [Sporolactobacillus laevolacticus]MDN3956050.1 phosphotransferase [Sporolactobacillus laevolacticus]